MTRAGLVKEIRALLPAWVVCMAAVGAFALLREPGFHAAPNAAFAAAAGLLVCALGSVALGALSIGHEYTQRTLTLLLSQPSSRGRLLLMKLGVLTPMILALCAIAFGTLFNPGERHPGFNRYWGENWSIATVLVLPALCGLFVAPWLTMLCRSPLAGVVFTIVVPIWIGALGEALAVATYGFSPESMLAPERFKLTVIWTAALGVCAVAAVSSWRMFARLEAIEGHDSHLYLPRWLRGPTIAVAPDFADARHRHPIWLLAKKELRLQQMSFAVSGLYVLGCGMLWWLRHASPGFSGLPFGALTIVHSVLMAVVIGSLASAEERQFGTLEWQVLLPVATWKQWAVKAATVFGLAIVLALGLPVLMMLVLPSADDIRVRAWDAVPVIVVATASLYISSLCTSGLRALLASIPFAPVVLAIAYYARLSVSNPGSLRLPIIPSRAYSPLTVRDEGSMTLLAFVLLAGFLGLVLRFALVNHRSAERGARRVWLQVVLMVGCTMAGSSLLVVSEFYR